MSVVEYSLFRVKFIRPNQRHLVFEADEGPKSPTDVYLAALNERPSVEIKEGYVWHIGNLVQYSSSTGYFAVGRTTKTTLEKFDRKSGDFIEEELETSPYTHCVYDARIGLLGIAGKSVLAPTAKGIAGKVQLLLANTKVVTRNHLDVEVLPIPDPSNFVTELEAAWQVLKFTATFKGPNPFDADEYFQKPLASLLSSANGKKGKAEITGDELDKTVLVELTRSAASTGNQATARIKRKKRKQAETIKLKGDAIKRRYKDSEHDPKDVISDLQEDYHQVRQDD